MPSFDIVNRLDHQEIDNALGNATREITTRYDFKGSETVSYTHLTLPTSDLV